MATGVRDLWPTDFPKLEVTPPLEILQLQAGNLDRKTKGILHGKVDKYVDGGNFVLSFRVVAPALEGYEYELFRLQHRVGLYPVSVEMSPSSGTTPKGLLDTEEKFVNWLEGVLNDSSTKRIISALLAQSGAPV